MLSDPSQQKFLGRRGLIIYISVMNMFVPVSTDLYLPALPYMSEYFSVSASLVNMTLVSFFFLYAIGLLFWGTISEKYGRKPIISLGMIIYVAASLGCTFAPNIYVLIICRALQGIGAGAITSVSTAVIKDCFAGKTRNAVLAVVQSMLVIAPMLAPILGAFLLQFTSWRGSFAVLALIGGAGLIISFLFRETVPLEHRYKGSLLGSLGRLIVVIKNKSFAVMLLEFSAPMLGFMAYIAISSYIYIQYFGLTSQQYSYFFAVNAFVALFGPIIYLRLSPKVAPVRLAIVSFAIALSSGIMIMTAGTMTPILFWISFVPFGLICSMMRPFGTALLLEQQKKDTGSAASLINFTATVAGSIGMILVSLDWSNMVIGMGFLCVLASSISIAAWVLMKFLKIKMTLT